MAVTIVLPARDGADRCDERPEYERDHHDGNEQNSAHRISPAVSLSQRPTIVATLSTAGAGPARDRRDERSPRYGRDVASVATQSSSAGHCQAHSGVT